MATRTKTKKLIVPIRGDEEVSALRKASSRYGATSKLTAGQRKSLLRGAAWLGWLWHPGADALAIAVAATRSRLQRLLSGRRVGTAEYLAACCPRAPRRLM